MNGYSHTPAETNPRERPQKSAHSTCSLQYHDPAGNGKRSTEVEILRSAELNPEPAGNTSPKGCSGGRSQARNYSDVL